MLRLHCLASPLPPPYHHQSRARARRRPIARSSFVARAHNALSRHSHRVLASCAPLSQVIYWKGKAEEAAALSETANELIVAAIGEDEGGAGSGVGPRGKGSVATPVLHRNVRRMVERLGSLDESLGQMKEQLDKAASAMEELRDKLTNADGHEKELVEGMREEARQQRQALVSTALSSMSHLRSHLIYSLTGLREVVTSAGEAPGGATAAHYAMNGVFAVAGSRAPMATRGSTTRPSPPQRWPRPVSTTQGRPSASLERGVLGPMQTEELVLRLEVPTIPNPDAPLPEKRALAGLQARRAALAEQHRQRSHSPLPLISSPKGSPKGAQARWKTAESGQAIFTGTRVASNSVPASRPPVRAIPFNPAPPNNTTATPGSLHELRSLSTPLSRAGTPRAPTDRAESFLSGLGRGSAW